MFIWEFMRTRKKLKRTNVDQKRSMDFEGGLNLKIGNTISTKSNYSDRIRFV